MYKEIPLGQLCHLKAGKFISSSDISNLCTNELYPCYGGNGVRGYVKTYTHEGSFPLIGRQGALCGNISFASGKFYATEHAVVVQPYEDVDIKWLYYLLTSMNLGQYATGAAQPGLSVSTLEKLVVCVPEKSLQKKLAKVFSNIDYMISIRKKQLAKLEELVKSRFVELFGTIHDNKFGFDIVTLQEVSAPIKDGTHQTPTYTNDTKNGYKFLSSKDVTTGKIDWSNLKYIPEDLHQALYSRIAPRIGDILLAKNGTTGIAAIVDRDEVFDIYVSLALIRPIGVNTTYLWAAINAPETKQQFDASLKGIGVPNLHLGEIKKARIILPPIERQEQFAAFVEQTDKSKLAIQKSLEQLETLKKALMQKYFG